MKTFKTFCEECLKENYEKIPKNVLDLYDYLKAGKSKMINPNTVSIVKGTFFHFTRSSDDKFNVLKFNKKLFYDDFGLDSNFDSGEGFLYCYALHDLDDKKRHIKSTYGKNCLILDGIAVNALIDVDMEYQNAVSFSSIKNKRFVEDFFDSEEYAKRDELYNHIDSIDRGK